MTLDALPTAFDALDAIVAASEGARPAVFLDYDGTLSPIVATPDLAVLGDGVEAALVRLVAVADVAIVSGRGLDDLRTRVGIAGLAYAGSHGFEVEYADGHRAVLGGGEAFEGALLAAAGELGERLAGTPGVLVERKRFALAVHTRQTPAEHEGDVRTAVFEVAARHPTLRASEGKRVLELRPAVAWHKGAVVEALLADLEAASGRRAVAYLGDDVTDEDAFRAVRARSGGAGVGIVVGERADGETAATHRLTDVAEVGAWLDALAARLDAARG